MEPQLTFGMAYMNEPMADSKEDVDGSLVVMNMMVQVA